MSRPRAQRHNYRVVAPVFVDGWTYLAFVAGALTSTGYLPQIAKGLVTKRLDDVSLLMPCVLGMGMLLWLVYGLARDDIAIIVANLIGSSLTVVLVLMKLHYARVQSS